MAMKIEGWRPAFDSFIRAAAGRPFVWGKFDCCLFPADALLIMTGKDPAADFRGRYRSASGALKQMKKHAKAHGYEAGMAGLGDQIFGDLGLQRIGALYAQLGDVMCLDFPDLDPAFGGAGAICLGREVAIMTADGPKSISITSAARYFNAIAWRV